MRRPTPNTLKLPARLFDELSRHDNLSARLKQHSNVSSRKDRRKAARVQKAQRNGLPTLNRRRHRAIDHRIVANKSFRSGDYIPTSSPNGEAIVLEGENSKSILKPTALPKELTAAVTGANSSPSQPSKLPSSVVARLEQDDAEIAALEKKLRIKSRKKLPQAFADDGLDALIEGLGKRGDVDLHHASNNQVARDWLAKKRSYLTFSLESRHPSTGEGRLNSEGKEVISNSSPHDGSSYGDTGEILYKSSDVEAVELENSFEDFGTESDQNPPYPRYSRMRENPYIAPASKRDQTLSKYLPLTRPPSLHLEASIHLRRQIQGLINRLTEANLLSILAGVEKLYQENARQHVTTALVDILLIPVCDSAALPSTLIILSAGFITALYKVIGTDFGAHAIEIIVRLFDEHYERANKDITSVPVMQAFDKSKGTSNLMALLAELYNFQVVGSLLIFDYIRTFLKNFSELNTELLLRIIRVSGPQLRHDDPSSLRDIVNMLRPAIVDIGEQNLSVRTKFMIESINDLKNNRAKAGAVASRVISEHTIRMRKTIGVLNTRTIRSSEPLRISLKDIQDSDKKGKWWLVGSSWAGNAPSHETTESQAHLSKNKNEHDSIYAEIGSLDLIQLAREQGMNTDIRRAIFVTIISASDHQDAYIRLVKLKLRKVQKLEIPRVIIHCSSAERYYNPYYTLISKNLCGDRKLRMAFQFSLWDILKRLGGFNERGDVEDDNNEEMSFNTRQLVNLGKMFGVLITEGGLGLSVLKSLDFRYLQAKTEMFIEVLLVALLLHTQPQSEIRRDEQAVMRVFSKVRDTPSMIKGLHYFLKEVLIKTDIAGGEAELATVRWAGNVAVSVLDSLSMIDG